MIPMIKCTNNDFGDSDNIFEVTLSNNTEEVECRIYDGVYEVKGILRISRSLKLYYEAPIDLVLFFDLPSALKMRCCFWYLKSPYPNDLLNYKITKDILKNKFESFMQKRFNYAQIPINATISNVSSIDYIEIFACDITLNWGISYDSTVIPIGILSAFNETTLNFNLAKDKDIFMTNGNDLEYWVQNPKHLPQYLVKPPFVKGVFATTLTNTNDFVVNVRNKPHKDSKIIMQLYSQNFRSKLQYEEFDLWIKTQKDAQKNYFIKNKDKMINPFYKDRNSKKDYIVFIDDILNGDWAKVRILRYDGYIDNKNRGDSIESKTYINLFLNEPSKITIILGYIHTSGLEPLSVFEREI